MRARRTTVSYCLCLIFIADLSLAQATQLRLIVLESGTEQPVPCRIHLKDQAGKAVQPNGLPFWHDHFVCPGVAELNLRGGTYIYEIERGPEYAQITGKVVLTDTGAQTVTNRLSRLVTLAKEGWWSGELHVHRRLAEVALLMKA